MLYYCVVLATNNNNTSMKMQAIKPPTLTEWVFMTFRLGKATKDKLRQLAGLDQRSMSKEIEVLITKEYKRRFGTDDVEVIGKVSA